MALVDPAMRPTRIGHEKWHWTAKVVLSKALLMSLIPNGLCREAGDIPEVGRPLACQEFGRVGLDLEVDPRVLVGAGLIVTVRNCQVVRNGEPENGEDQVLSADCEVVDYCLRRAQ